MMVLAKPAPLPNPDGTTSHSTKPASGQVAGYPPQRTPLSNSLDETTSHSTRLQTTAAKSLVIPQAGERTNEKGNLESSGEETNDRCANLSLHLADENATIALAQRLAARLKPGMVIYLRGDLGAGKTTLVRGMLNALGYGGRVKSPTYTLVEPYHAAGLDLRHFDLYRLRDEDEWEAAGFRDEFDGQNIFFIEWPENAQGLIPHADMEIAFEILEQGRNTEIHANTEIGKQCLKQL